MPCHFPLEDIRSRLAQTATGMGALHPLQKRCGEALWLVNDRVIGGFYISLLKNRVSYKILDENNQV